MDRVCWLMLEYEVEGHKQEREPKPVVCSGLSHDNVPDSQGDVFLGEPACKIGQ